VTIVFNVNQSF